MIPALIQMKRDVARWYVRYAPGVVGKSTVLDKCLNAELRDHPVVRQARNRVGAPHFGANIGYYSLFALHLVGESGKVVSIEAYPRFHSVLVDQAEANNRTNLRAVNAAISDRDDVLTFVLASSRNMEANSIVPYASEAKSTFEAQARRLPDVLTAEGIAKARVIKVDVEGAEGAAVRGLEPVLDQLRPDVELAIEVTPHRMTELGHSAEEQPETFMKRGFNVYRPANDYAAGSFSAALHRGAQTPIRWRGQVTDESELIFSRVDAEELR
ncbi:FkbM family methyltransferase [Streptomyces purpurogeneiscleroticus]|uniref:FkbM family methyltransferase n=1 Tax=Streptomyces purpurogeneiscleroticus TaxID=68259 RepID=UPI001CC12C49|nr:FkbM family methyltransferase [Streptomyces purpurogeneiscleroticus]MBZ4015844.1 hypothetical protein [Streptomyces purpurogeneiscleroticus]